MMIGETIRRCRKLCQLTQAQLAREVGVSVQAISKWETGAGTPDISQIIPLARALRVTTDALLQFKDRREEFENLWRETMDKTHADPHQLREVSMSALEAYPDDTAFLLRAAMSEESFASMTENDREKQGHLHSALGHLRRLLQLDPENDGAKMHLVRIYSQLGMDDQAVALAYQCKGRAEALKYCLKGDALRRHRQKIIDRKLLSLLSELTQEDMAMLDAAEGIIRAAIPDGNYQHYYESLAAIYMKRFGLFWARGDVEAACSTLRQVLEMAKEADRPRHRQFTAPLFDLLANINPEDIPDRAWRWILSYIEQEIPQWRDTEALAEVVNDAYAYLAELKIL